MEYAAIWGVLALFSLLAEAAYPSLFIYLPIALSCGITSIISWIYSMLWLDITVMCVITPLLFVVFRMWSRNAQTVEPTNVYALVGKSGYVTTPIFPDRKGYITIDSMAWRAAADIYIPKNTRVRIVDIHGCHVIVRHIETSK